MKISPADKYFSLCIRERADFTCEYCGNGYRHKPQGLHCSHLFSRRHYATRFHQAGAFAHCYSCHQRLGGNPVIFTRWAEKELGWSMLETLRELHLDTSLGKLMRKAEKEIGAYYRGVYEDMKQQRAAGHTGRLEFVGYA